MKYRLKLINSTTGEVNSLAKALKLGPIGVIQTLQALVAKLFEALVQSFEIRIVQVLFCLEDEVQECGEIFAKLKRLPIAHIGVIKQLGPDEFGIKGHRQGYRRLLQTVGEQVVGAIQPAKGCVSGYLAGCGLLSGFEDALQIVVDGETTALVYADDFAEPRIEGHGSDEVNMKFAEALRHHTVALLMRLTSELKTMAELRAYAGSLLTEIEQMYHSDVSAGKEGEELKKRLLANLDYARSIYGNRAQFESPAAAALLDAQVSALIDTHHESAFGRDLAVVVEWAAGSRAAEAS